VRAHRFETYQEYAKLINDQSRRHMTLRGLFDFVVDPAKSIARRSSPRPRSSSASPPARCRWARSRPKYATLAVAMNRIGGKSNTGEGGEDPALPRRDEGERSPSTPSATSSARATSSSTSRSRPAIRYARGSTVASGRFGVTTGTVSATAADRWRRAAARAASSRRQGQRLHRQAALLGARRRPDLAAAARHLLDRGLAQLIHDLKNANKKASISVKLVSEAGVGTVAAGMAKAKADHVVIAGHDGGAFAVGSISTGTPWAGAGENAADAGAQPPARPDPVQADGQMKTGRDVVVGALLGADEFGFATAPLVAEGCIMVRKCPQHLPGGRGDQDQVLRAKFQGGPSTSSTTSSSSPGKRARSWRSSASAPSTSSSAGSTCSTKGIAHWKAKGSTAARPARR
jgi:glutamate synthase (NADPH/NADH) large chain